MLSCIRATLAKEKSKARKKLKILEQDFAKRGHKRQEYFSKIGKK